MMLEPEKLQNRGKQGWPDAGKGTGHKGDKKVNTLVRHKRTPIEQPNALGGKQRLPKQGKNVCSITGQPHALGGKQRLSKQGRNVSSITGQQNALGGKQRLPKQGRNVSSITGQPKALGGKNSAFCACAALTVTSTYTYKFLHALRGCSRSLPYGGPEGHVPLQYVIAYRMLRMMM